MEKYRYEDILRRLEGFDEWLIALGVKPGKNDRIHKAFDIVREAFTATQKGLETGTYSPLLPHHLFPLIESLEALDIFTAFKTDHSELLITAVKRALSGPAQPIDEERTNRDGRNIWFELALAAEWILQGAMVELGEPDLRLSWDQKLFLVACKRPANEHSVRPNIRSSILQLNNNLKCASKETFGVVAISVNSILNPGDKYWGGNLDSLGLLLQRLMNEYQRHWRSVEADPRICAILFHVATPSDIGQEVDLARLSFTVAGPLNQFSGGTAAFQKFTRDMKLKARNADITSSDQAARE